MYIGMYSCKYGGGQYIGALKQTLFIKVEILASTYVKNKPYGQNTLNDVIMRGVVSSVKRKPAAQ